MLLILILQWLRVTEDCLGRPLLFPEQVTYTVPYLVREMVADPACPLDEAGQPQVCAVYTGAGEWVTGAPNLDVGWIAPPSIGAVFDVQEPVAVTPLHRSTDRCE